MVTGTAGLFGAATDQAGRLAEKRLLKEGLPLADELISGPLEERLAPLLFPKSVLVTVLVLPDLPSTTGGVVSPLLAAAEALLR